MSDPATVAPPGSRPTDRELEVLGFVAMCGSYDDAAKAMGLSTRSIHSALTNVRSRLGARSTLHAYFLALISGYLQPPRQ